MKTTNNTQDIYLSPDDIAHSSKFQETIQKITQMIHMDFQKRLQEKMLIDAFSKGVVNSILDLESAPSIEEHRKKFSDLVVNTEQIVAGLYLELFDACKESSTKTPDELGCDTVVRYDYNEETNRGYISFKANPCEFERIVERVSTNVSSEPCYGCRYCQGALDRNRFKENE